MIRRANPDDLTRMAEILVFNNRKYYYPIFNDINYSFKEFNVVDVSKMLEEYIYYTYVFEDEVVKGFVIVKNAEIIKLYVDSFFQGQGIGKQLLDFAVTYLRAFHLWALEKNEKALKFYQNNNFVIDGIKKQEEGTNEFLLHLVSLKTIKKDNCSLEE